MNEIAVKEPPSVISDMAARFGMDKRAFEATIRQTCMPAKVEVTNEQFAAFLLVAKQYGLNPITKEIYAFPARTGGIQPIVSVDGWCNIINSRPELDGIEFDDIKDEQGKLTAIACKIFRKDRAHPVVCIEYMAECKQDKDTWKKWPARMLRHKALIQAARYAFGFSGIVDPDEAERMVDVTPGPKSLFKSASLRNKWCDNIIDSIEKAQGHEELEQIREMNQPKMDEMTTNGHEHDVLAVEVVEQRLELARSRFEQKNNATASFGEGFANIDNDEPASFAATDLPSEIPTSSFAGRIFKQPGAV